MCLAWYTAAVLRSLAGSVIDIQKAGARFVRRFSPAAAEAQFGVSAGLSKEEVAVATVSVFGAWALKKDGLRWLCLVCFGTSSALVGSKKGYAVVPCVCCIVALLRPAWRLI
jgi:hypothetical protein